MFTGLEQANQNSNIFVLALALLTLAGCGQEPAASTGSESDSLDSLLAELDELPGGSASEDAPKAAAPAEAVGSVARLTPPMSNATLSERVEAPAADGLDLTMPESPAASGTRRLQFMLGDRFPIEKQVTQQISDASTGAPGPQLSTRTQMELTVTDVTGDAILFELRYKGVQCLTKIGQQTQVWDSRSGSPALAQFTGEAGLVNNAIGFQLSPTNSVVAVNGYEQFIHRCVAGYSPQQQPAARQQLAQKFSADSLADFVDETMGLIPFDGTKLVVGSMLPRKRRIPGGDVISSYRVGSVTPQAVHLTIDGRLSANQSTPGITLKAGHSQGVCEIDLATGLPLSVERSEVFVVDVARANGSVESQSRQVRTTVRTSPRVRVPVVQSRAANAGMIQQVGASTPVGNAGMRVSGIPTSPTTGQTTNQPPLSSTATAVYPD